MCVDVKCMNVSVCWGVGMSGSSLSARVSELEGVSLLLLFSLAVSLAVSPLLLTPPLALLRVLQAARDYILSVSCSPVSRGVCGFGIWTRPGAYGSLPCRASHGALLGHSICVCGSYSIKVS